MVIFKIPPFLWHLCWLSTVKTDFPLFVFLPFLCFQCGFFCFSIGCNPLPSLRVLVLKLFLVKLTCLSNPLSLCVFSITVIPVSVKCDLTALLIWISLLANGPDHRCFCKPSLMKCPHVLLSIFQLGCGLWVKLGWGAKQVTQSQSLCCRKHLLITKRKIQTLQGRKLTDTTLTEWSKNITSNWTNQQYVLADMTHWEEQNIKVMK